MESTDELDRRTNTVMENLKEINLRPERLNDEEVVSLLASYFDSDSRMGVKPENLSSLIKAPIEVGRDSIMINHMLNQVIAADKLPDSVVEGWLEKLVSMQGDFDFVIHYNPYDSARSLILLNDVNKKRESDLLGIEKRGESPPVSLQIELKDGKEVIEDIQRGRDKLSSTSIYVNARAHRKKSLRQLTDRIKSAFHSVMIEPKIVSLRIEAGYRSILPLARDRLGMTRTLPTSSVSAFFPFLSPGMAVDNEGILIGVNCDSGRPVIVDQFKLMNANGLMIGTSGSGKSYAGKSLCSKDLFHLDRLTFIIDREGEYRALTEAWDGQTVKISPDSETSLNPFDLMGCSLIDKKLSLHAFFHTIFQEISDPQEAMLDEALFGIYEDKGITDDPNTWLFTPPRFENFYNFIRGKEDDKDKDNKRTARSLSKRLKKFTTGSLNFLNQQTNVDLNNRLVTFDIRDVPKIAAQATTFTILDYLLNRMRHDLRRKTILIEECWTILSNPYAGDYILQMAKMGRKNNTCLLVITQQTEDLTKKSGEIIAPSVLGNSSWKVILFQDNSVLKNVVNTFGLNKREARRVSRKEDIKSGGQGKGLLLVENTSIPLRIVASPEEHKLITTNPDEIRLLNQNTSKNPVEYEDTTYRTDREIIPLSELDDEEQIKDLRKQGYHIARSPAFGRGRGSRYILKNDTQESDSHFILRNLIYEEVKKHTSKVRTYHPPFPQLGVNN